MNNKELIIKIISQSLGLSDKESKNLLDNTDLLEYGLDSLTAIEIVVNLENKFTIIIDDNDLLIENMNSIEKIVGLIERYIQIR